MGRSSRVGVISRKQHRALVKKCSSPQRREDWWSVPGWVSELLWTTDCHVLFPLLWDGSVYCGCTIPFLPLNIGCVEILCKQFVSVVCRPSEQKKKLYSRSCTQRFTCEETHSYLDLILTGRFLTANVVIRYDLAGRFLREQWVYFACGTCVNNVWPEGRLW